MTYDEMVAKYVEVRDTVKLFEAKFKERVAVYKQEMEELENAITTKADEEGLTTVPTPHGTAYWSTLANCTAAAPDDFMQFVIDNEAWDLVEKRPVKTAVKAYVETHGAPPPGVNFSTYRKFNLRASRKDDSDE